MKKKQVKEDKTEAIVSALKYKASTKQLIYRNTMEIFSRMKAIAEEVTDELAARFAAIDPHVIIEYSDKNQFEFHVKFSGDLLVFTMHSNVITFPPDHILYKNEYCQEDSRRIFFGHIMVYNFMADSIKYNRLHDPGYFVARLLLNFENHFYVEGVKQLNFLHPDVATNIIAEDILKLFIESAMLLAIETDLQAPPLQEIMVISLQEKTDNMMVHGGEKVGFKMKAGQNR